MSIADPQCIVRYAERIQTQQEHTLEIRKYSGYKEFSHRCGGFALMRFLYARIWIGTERPSVIFDLATAWLLDKKVLLPGVTTLTRLISTIRERVAERLWQRLSAAVSPEQRTDLEGLLARAGVSRITNLERLRRAPSRASACLVDYQAQIPLAQAWGGGEVASADGLRFVVPLKTLNAGPNPKYFGTGRGITLVNYTSDQFSGFKNIVVTGTLRDSTEQEDAPGQNTETLPEETIA